MMNARARVRRSFFLNVRADARLKGPVGPVSPPFIRDGEIVLTESYDGRAPYTITLKEVSD